MPAGRPCKYTKAKAIAICARLAEGEPLVAICRDDDAADVSTVYRWLLVHAEFREMYARAREDQADTLADQIIDIADDGTRDYVKDAEGIARVDHDHINRARLRVDARKWIAAKLKPRKYGEKLELGSDPQRPIVISSTDSNL
jgi:hypothetical protein